MISVSIFIPVYNGEEYLPSLFKVLNDFLDQAKNRYVADVWFIDSNSTDDSLEKIRLAGFKYHSISAFEFDHGGTRSMARELCESDIILYLTQDALPLSSDDIDELISVFKNEAIGAAYGRQLPYEGSNLFGKHLRYFNYMNKSYIRDYEDRLVKGIKAAFLSNSFAAYRRTAMDQIGWFKNGLILGEDTYAGAKLLKVGYKLAYVDTARVYHSHTYTVWEDFKRYFDIGVFHSMENWILCEFGKPEGEGLRYIKSEFTYILDCKQYFLLPEFLFRNFMKYLGYKFGMHYLKLPRPLIVRFSMHNLWWDKYWRN